MKGCLILTITLFCTFGVIFGDEDDFCKEVRKFVEAECCDGANAQKNRECLLKTLPREVLNVVGEVTGKSGSSVFDDLCQDSSLFDQVQEKIKAEGFMPSEEQKESIRECMEG